MTFMQVLQGGQVVVLLYWCLSACPSKRVFHTLRTLLSLLLWNQELFQAWSKNTMFCDLAILWRFFRFRPDANNFSKKAGALQVS